MSDGLQLFLTKFFAEVIEPVSIGRICICDACLNAERMSECHLHVPVHRYACANARVRVSAFVHASVYVSVSVSGDVYGDVMDMCMDTCMDMCVDVCMCVGIFMGMRVRTTQYDVCACACACVLVGTCVGVWVCVLCRCIGMYAYV